MIPIGMILKGGIKTVITVNLWKKFHTESPQ